LPEVAKKQSLSVIATDDMWNAATGSARDVIATALIRRREVGEALKRRLRR
jgi:hypothetical protein